MLSHREVQWFSDTVRAMYRARTPGELGCSILDDLDRRGPPTVTAVEEFNLNVSIYLPHSLRIRGPVPSDVEAYVHDNPILTNIQHGRWAPVMQLSSLITRPAWERTDNYNGIARVTGFNDQLCLFADASDTFVTVSLFSEKPCTASDRLLATLIQPHLQAAWKRVKKAAAPQKSVRADHSLDPRIILKADLQPRDLQCAQRALLKRYFPRWQPGPTLPAELLDWMYSWLLRWENQSFGVPLPALATHVPAGKLVARFFPPNDVDVAVLQLTEVPIATIKCRPSVSLSRREREIVHWISLGKRDAEIGLILGITHRTVSKHVENILHKLGASTRTAAARLFLAASAH